MKIEIISTPKQDGETFAWKLWTGPDGIDEYEGECNSFKEVIHQIAKAEKNNSIYYTMD